MANSFERSVQLFFVSFLTPDYSRSSVLLNFTSTGVEKQFRKLRNQWWFIGVDFWRLKSELQKDAILVIMSPSHKAAIIARLVVRNTIVLDAGWPLMDGALSRHASVFRIHRVLVAYIIDFLSFHSADLVLLETEKQVQRVQSLFRVPHVKLKVSYTSLNETAFRATSTSSKIVDNLRGFISERPRRVNILFRGKVNNEAGLDHMLAAALLLEEEANFVFLIGTSNSLPKLGANCIVISDVSSSELAEIYSLVDVALGQLSNHPRLRYTIPHKAFEAGYFGKCYITTLTPGILEVYRDTSIYLLDEPITENLVVAIKSFGKEGALKTKQREINEDYVMTSSQGRTNMHFMEILLDYFQK
jgi:hypothetical protein